jgi:multidrug efflux pump subunit AcrA (membrane-fusion protein)
MFGHLRLIGSGAYDGLLIPDQAVTTQQSDEIAYVVAANGEVEQRKLVLGPRIGNLRVVRSGLEDTDTVVIDGIQRAKAGTRVTAKAGKITPPDPDSMPSPVDASPPPASATFPDSTR